MTLSYFSHLHALNTFLLLTASHHSLAASLLHLNTYLLAPTPFPSIPLLQGLLSARFIQKSTIIFHSRHIIYGSITSLILIQIILIQHGPLCGVLGSAFTHSNTIHFVHSKTLVRPIGLTNRSTGGGL